MTEDKSNVPYDTMSRTSVSSQSFNKCCFVVPLRTGCFILGYLNLVLNCFQTLALIGFTAFVGAVTHGFDHFDKGGILINDQPLTGTPDDSDKAMLTQLGIILGVILLANVAWIVLTIACLVGLHKKKPGPIRVYVGFATARLMLSLAAFIFLLMSNKAHNQTVVTHCIDLGLSAYFIMVYYIYANRLERERASEIAAPALPNNVFIYPVTLDKSHLVAEEKKQFEA